MTRGCYLLTLKPADTDFESFIVSVHVAAVPEHAPPHSVSFAFLLFGDAVSVTVAPLGYVPLQDAPLQVMLPGPEVDSVRL